MFVPAEGRKEIGQDSPVFAMFFDPAAQTTEIQLKKETAIRKLASFVDTNTEDRDHKSPCPGKSDYRLFLVSPSLPITRRPPHEPASNDRYEHTAPVILNDVVTIWKPSRHDQTQENVTVSFVTRADVLSHSA